MSEQNSQFFRVVDFNPAAQAVQGMESRGDFQYKGIYRFFTTINEWTEKFLANKILPNAEQLTRDITLEKDKVDFFINELCFRANPPIIKKITTVEFELSDMRKSENLTTGLRRNTVFARPSTLDAGSSQRYINGCNERSVAAIKRAIAEVRTPWHGDKFKDYVFARINANKLSETYASHDIGNLFNCPYDSSKQLKEITVNTHLKPVLKKLVDDKILLFFRNEKALKSANKSIFLYNSKDEVIERIEIYVNYLKKHIIPSLQKIGVIGGVSDEEYSDFASLATKILAYMDDSYGDQKYMVEELIILGAFYENYREEIKRKEQKDKIIEVVKLVENAGKLVDISTIRVNGEPIPKEIIPAIVGNESILYAEYDDGNTYFEFLLHRSAVNLAVDLAKKIYQSTGNDTDVRILSKMNINANLDENLKKDFYAIEMESLFKYLPFLTRMWRTIMGNIYVTKAEAEAIRRQKEMEQKKRINESKAKQIAKEKSKLVEERMKQIEEIEQGLPLGDNKETDVEKKLSPEEEKQVKDVLQSIITTLDTAWDAKLFPDREYVMQNVKTGMSEDQFVMFLKKYSMKDILSFQVKSKTNKFKWPILVTRHYLKRHGKRLLEIARREAETERRAPAPDQDKFDLYSYMEEFLERVLPRI
ncbi:MAG: hypothetical protein KBF93_00665 [Leptospiraceae bacterium]|nr:hypothetical protein [Leptospiraceae bacterium]